MAHLSPLRAAWPKLQDLTLLNRGKVRDTYDLGNNFLLVIATDSVSIFDFVLNALIPEKGYVLTAMTHFWMTYLESIGIKTHFVAAGSKIDAYLPAHLRNNADLQRRAMVVKKLNMIPVEFIERFCLAGSVVDEYRKHGTIYGKKVEEGLGEGDRLHKPIFTPTTKAHVGHDMPIDADGIRAQYPHGARQFERASLLCHAKAAKRGIIVADSKGELSEDGTICDEWFTPDSSRIWDAKEWLRTREGPRSKTPSSFDKQLVRDFGSLHGISGKLDPENPEHIERAHALLIPDDVIDQTTHHYRYVFWRLTGMTLETYAREKMQVHVERKRVRRVALVFGSRSDILHMEDLLKELPNSANMLGIGKVFAHVISCHRNLDALREFVARRCDDADVVVAIAGKAAALPGMLATLIQTAKLSIPVIGVGVGDRGSTSWKAAKLSIEELPGEMVILDEIEGEAYMGLAGLRSALRRIAYGELPPMKKPIHKEAELFVYQT